MSSLKDAFSCRMQLDNWKDQYLGSLLVFFIMDQLSDYTAAINVIVCGRK